MEREREGGGRETQTDTKRGGEKEGEREGGRERRMRQEWGRRSGGDCERKTGCRRWRKRAPRRVSEVSKHLLHLLTSAKLCSVFLLSVLRSCLSSSPPSPLPR